MPCAVGSGSVHRSSAALAVDTRSKSVMSHREYESSQRSQSVNGSLSKLAFGGKAGLKKQFAQIGVIAVTKRRPCPPAPGPLERYAAHFDALFTSLAQRRGFRQYLAGLLLPRDRNKTLTALAGAEPIVQA